MTTRQTPDAVRECENDFGIGQPNLREALQAVADAMLKGGDGAVGDFGWSITKLNRARPLILAALDSRAGDAGEERDALLAALGWKTGPFSDPATRRVILEDTAGLRPEMVKARRRAQEAEGSSMMWYSIIGEFVHDSRSGVLGRMWNEVKRLRAQVRKLQAATPAPAVDAQEGDDEGPCTDCWDTGITIQTERACSCDAGDQYRVPAVDAVPAGEVRKGCVGIMDPARATYFLERFKREEKLLGPHEQWALDYTIAMLAALSHGEGRK